MPQTDAFARGEHHSGHGDWTEGGRPEDSKLHTVLKHPEENRSGFTTNDAFHQHGPEIVTSRGAHGIVHEDDVGAAHPESRTKSKAETTCAHEPGSC